MLAIPQPIGSEVVSQWSSRAVTVISGTVTSDREAVVPLVLLDSNGQQQGVEAVLDTGFTGFLTLPHNIIVALNLTLVGNRRATLGDGSRVVLDLYLGWVIWHEQEREVLVLQAEGGALIGMSLLYGSQIILNVVEDGVLRIDALS